MGALDAPVAIEMGGHIRRARRTAATTRAAMAALGLGALLAWPSLLAHPALGYVAFVTIAATALVQLAAPRLGLVTAEESLAGVAGVLLIGLGDERVNVLGVLWLVAVASGVLARGGRAHWLGRAILLGAMLLPVARLGELSGSYAAFCLASIGLLLTSGRLTRELNLLLRQARLQAESAETLLFAGDLAARVSERGGAEPREESRGLRDADVAGAAEAVEELVRGRGLSLAVQPIVDIRSGEIHAYEALARFEQRHLDGGPLPWFALAEKLGRRAELERACLRRALELLAVRPEGTALSVNLSAPVLLEAATLAMLDGALRERSGDLRGLIVEVTEETLVNGSGELQDALRPLLAAGVALAVDDMGAGYSGLRQITSVRPGYLKLDRSLVTGIDADPERGALVTALAGYSRQVGCLLVAEGVENAAELETVRALGVPLVQGFHLARPAAPWPTLERVEAEQAGSRVPGDVPRAASSELARERAVRV